MFLAIWNDTEKNYTYSGLTFARVYAVAMEKEKEGYIVTLYETCGRGRAVIGKEDIDYLRRKA